jgi:hypothetical protein
MRSALAVLLWTVSASAYAAACPLFDTNLRSAVGANVLNGDSCAFNNDNQATCAAGASGPDTTLLWRAPLTGRYQFDLDGSSYDTALHIRDPLLCTELVCNDDFFGLDSKVEYDVVANQEYLLVVDGYNGGCGQFILNISLLQLAPVYQPTLDMGNTDGFCPGDQEFVVWGATPNADVALVTGTPGAEGPIPTGNCAGIMLPFTRPRLIDISRTNAVGDATFNVRAPQAACARNYLVAVDLSTCQTSNIQTP